MACRRGFSVHVCGVSSVDCVCHVVCTCLSRSLPPPFMSTCRLRAVALTCLAVCGVRGSGSRRNQNQALWLLEGRAEVAGQVGSGMDAGATDVLCPPQGGHKYSPYRRALVG